MRRWTRARRPAAPRRSSDKLATHILPTAATMVGVCMTVLSLGQLAGAGTRRMVIDKLLAVDACLFLASALLSFTSMRRRRAASTLEQTAELLFLAGLVLLALGAVGVAFVVA